MSRTVIKNLMANTVAFLLVFTAIGGVYFLVYRYVIFTWWLLAVPFFLMQFFRARIRNPYIFITLHVLAAAGTTFIVGNAYDRWFILAFMIICVVYSFFMRMAGERSLDFYVGFWVTAIYIAVYILMGQTTANPDIIRQQLIASSLITLGLVIVHIHMDNIDASLTIANHRRTHHADKIISANNSLIAVFIALVFTAGIAAIVLPLGRMVSNIFRTIMTSRLFLAGRSMGGMTLGLDRPPVPVEHVPGDDTCDYYKYDHYEPYPLDEAPAPYFDYDRHLALMDRIYFIVFLLVVAGIFLAIYLFIKNFYHKHRKAEQKKSDDDDNISLERNILGDIRDLLPRFGKYSKNAIRRAYAKKVNQHIRRGINVQNSDTTDIIANKIRNIENIDELTSQYEKVRYFK